MSGIYQNYTLSLDGTPSNYIYGDHFGISVTAVSYLLNGVSVQPTSGSVTLEWSYDGITYQAFNNGAYSLPNGASGASINASIRYIRATGSVDGADSVVVGLRLDNEGVCNSDSRSMADKAFEEGKSYRIDYPFSIPQNGGPIVLKYIVSEPTFLTLSTIEIDQGGILYRVYTEAQATETTPFDVNVPIYPKNLTVPIQTSPVEILNNGAATFTGEQNTTLRVRTASGGGNRNSAVTGESTQRGFGVSIVYAEISVLEGVNVETQGVLKQEFYKA